MRPALAAAATRSTSSASRSSTRIEEAIEWADALNILRLQLERMTAGYIPSLREYNRVFGVTRERLERAPSATCSSCIPAR